MLQACLWSGFKKNRYFSRGSRSFNDIQSKIFENGVTVFGWTSSRMPENQPSAIAEGTFSFWLDNRGRNTLKNFHFMI